MLANNKGSGDDGFLSDEEKAQLLNDLQEAKEEVEKMDNLAVEIDELKKKIK
jgi:hypothetical protein